MNVPKRGTAPLLFWQRLRGVMQEARTTPEAHAEAVRLASAVLLVELARADASHSGEERAALHQQLRERFALDTDETETLLTAAEQSADQSVSLHRYVDDINRGLDYAEKKSVLKMLWQIAYADGALHHHEEHLLRRIADLLHLGHSDFIRLKLQVLGGFSESERPGTAGADTP